MTSVRYTRAEDVKTVAVDIVRVLQWKHVDLERVHFIRSAGSRSKRIVARIHGMSKALQEALLLEPNYVIEVIGERYDKLRIEEKERIVLHELMHIPKGFKGGLLPHKNRINRRRIEKLHRAYTEERSNKSNASGALMDKYF